MWDTGVLRVLSDFQSALPLVFLQAELIGAREMSVNTVEGHGFSRAKSAN
jgi:hypothetical protein